MTLAKQDVISKITTVIIDFRGIVLKIDNYRSAIKDTRAVCNRIII
jgi:hypothetical protein